MVIGKPHRVFMVVIDGLCVLVKHLKKGVGKCSSRTWDAFNEKMRGIRVFAIPKA